MNKTGIELIAQEREEQISKHGFSSVNDKRYKDGQLMQAARYCIRQSGWKPRYTKSNWPADWDSLYAHKIMRKTNIEKLVVAGALLMAENYREPNNSVSNLIKKIAIEIDRLQAMEVNNKEDMK